MLDVVTYIQRKLDSTLAYRYRVPRRHVRLVRNDGQRRGALDLPHARRRSGRGGSRCESHRLPTCRSYATSSTDMREFFNKWTRARGYYKGSRTRHDDSLPVKPASKEAQALQAGIECIGCGVCYASCDVVAWRTDYLGPAALNRAWTLVNDVRDGARSERLRAVAGDAGCHQLPYAHELYRALPKTSLADARRSRA